MVPPLKKPQRDVGNSTSDFGAEQPVRGSNWGSDGRNSDAVSGQWTARKGDGERETSRQPSRGKYTISVNFFKSLQKKQFPHRHVILQKDENEVLILTFSVNSSAIPKDTG